MVEATDAAVAGIVHAIVRGLRFQGDEDAQDVQIS
jgi:hypothetical protein